MVCPAQGRKDRGESARKGEDQVTRQAGWAFAAAAALALCGCDEVFQNRTTRSLDRAEEKEKHGDYRAAVQFYEASLDGTPKGADVHYRLALIYDDKIKDPISATHH